MISLKDNKPMLVDHLLQPQYNVLHNLEEKDIENLYKDSWTEQHVVYFFH